MRAQLLEWSPRIRRGALLAVVGGTPVLFLRTGLDPFNVPKLAWLGVGVVLAAALRTAEALQGVRLRLTRDVLIPGAALIGALGIAWIFSPYRMWAVLGHFGRFQGLLPYALAVLLAILVYDAFLNDARPLLWAIAISAGVVSAYALIQTIGADPFIWNAFGAPTRAISTLGNPNFTGGFLAVGLPVALGLALSERDRSATAFRIAALIAAGWVAARSEGAYAGGVAGCAVLLGVYLADRRAWLPRAGLAVAGLLALGVVIVGVIGATRNLPLVPHTLELRGGWWLSAGRMGLDHPVVGRGPNSYAIEGVQYRGPRDAEELGYNFTDDPHSIPMAWFASAGLLGALAYTVVAGSAIRAGLGLGPGEVLSAAIFGGLLAYLIQGLASIDELSLRIAFWALLPALVITRRVDTKRTREKARSPGKKIRTRQVSAPVAYVWALPFLALVVVGAMVAATVLLLADKRVQEAQATAATDPAASVAMFAAAIALRDDPYYRYQYGLQIGNAAVEAEGGNEALLEEATDVFEYVDSFPDLRGIVGYGRILYEWSEATTDDRYADALTQFRRAIELDPRNPMIRVEAADVLIALRDFDEALSILEPAAELVGSDSHPEVWGALALAYAESGNTEEAETAIAIARSLNPDDARANQATRVLKATSIPN